MARSKGFDFKALLLNHGEKFGAAVVGLLALTGLATANWSGCTRLESELRAIAEKTKESWSSPNNAWPEDKKVVFASTPDVERMAQRMASPNEDIEQFTTLRRWNPPINQVHEKLSPVVVLSPESPESSLVTFTLLVKDDEPEVDDEVIPGVEKAAEEMSAEEQDLADLFGAKPSGVGAGGVGAGGVGPGGIGPGGSAAYPGDAASSLYGGAESGGGAGYGIPMGGSGSSADLSLGGYGGGGGYMGMGMGMGTEGGMAAPV